MGGVGGFVNGYLVPAFEKTFLPVVLLKAYGYALPFVEVALGVLLIIGLCRNCTLLLTGLTLISLAFGQMLLQQHATVANIFLYIVLTVVVLFLDEHDSWRPGHKPSSSDKSGCGCSCG
jgi:thiosulfate dehydrogenase [quinone] large subunit